MRLAVAWLVGCAAFQQGPGKRVGWQHRHRRARELGSATAPEDPTDLLERARRLREEVSAAEALLVRRAARGHNDEAPKGNKMLLSGRQNPSSRFPDGPHPKGGLRQSLFHKAVTPGCTIVARRDVAQHGIVHAHAYRCEAIYFQGVNSSTGLVGRVYVNQLDDEAPAGCAGWTMYVRLFSPRFHTTPVVVRPEEAGLISLREEILDALQFAIPIALVCAVVDSVFGVLVWAYWFMHHLGPG